MLTYICKWKCSETLLLKHKDKRISNTLEERVLEPLTLNAVKRRRRRRRRSVRSIPPARTRPIPSRTRPIPLQIRPAPHHSFVSSTRSRPILILAAARLPRLPLMTYPEPLLVSLPVLIQSLFPASESWP